MTEKKFFPPPLLWAIIKAAIAVEFCRIIIRSSFLWMASFCIFFFSIGFIIHRNHRSRVVLATRCRSSSRVILSKREKTMIQSFVEILNTRRFERSRKFQRSENSEISCYGFKINFQMSSLRHCTYDRTRVVCQCLGVPRNSVQEFEEGIQNVWHC